MLNDQEIISLARAYAVKKKKEYDFQSVAAVTQDHLRKNNFELFAKLREKYIKKLYIDMIIYYIKI